MSSIIMALQDLKGIHSAREFVWWYNGHPDICDLSPDLKNTQSAVVLGQVYFDFASYILILKQSNLVTKGADSQFNFYVTMIDS